MNGMKEREFLTQTGATKTSTSSTFATPELMRATIVQIMTICKYQRISESKFIRQIHNFLLVKLSGQVVI